MIVDMKVELLYFDGCPNWVEMDARVRAALESVSCGDGEVERVLVSTPAQAEEMGFPGSPTVLVDGRDPFAEPGAGSIAAVMSWPGCPRCSSSPGPSRG